MSSQPSVCQRDILAVNGNVTPADCNKITQWSSIKCKAFSIYSVSFFLFVCFWLCAKRIQFFQMNSSFCLVAWSTFDTQIQPQLRVYASYLVGQLLRKGYEVKTSRCLLNFNCKNKIGLSGCVRDLSHAEILGWSKICSVY